MATFCKRNFQIGFFDYFFFHFVSNSTGICSLGSIDNESWLVQALAWYRTGRMRRHDVMWRHHIDPHSDTSSLVLTIFSHRATMPVTSCPGWFQSNIRLALPIPSDSCGDKKKYSHSFNIRRTKSQNLNVSLLALHLLLANPLKPGVTLR